VDNVFCHNCGHRNPLGVNFCSSCGAVLVVAVVGTIGLGVYPTPVVHMVNQSANFFWLH